eukprot:7989377-Pyramimonas_sp.AAC.2
MYISRGNVESISRCHSCVTTRNVVDQRTVGVVETLRRNLDRRVFGFGFPQAEPPTDLQHYNLAHAGFTYGQN